MAAGSSTERKAIDLIRNELDVTMALTGVRSVKQIGPGLIDTGQ